MAIEDYASNTSRSPRHAGVTRSRPAVGSAYIGAMDTGGTEQDVIQVHVAMFGDS